MELCGRRKDGSEFSAEISLSPIRTEDGTLVASAIRDITEREQAQVALRQSEERFRLAFENAPIGTAIVGLDYRFRKVNNALCEMLGYTQQELLELTFADITYPEDIDEDLELAKQLFQGQIPNYRLEKRYITKRGQTIWVNLTASVVRAADGRPLYGLGLVENIHERKQAQDALQRSEALNRGIVEAVPAGIIHVSIDGKIVQANNQAKRILGLSFNELTRRFLADFSAETIREDRSPYPAEEYPVNLCLATKRRQGPRTFGVRRPDGAVAWIIVSAVPLFDDAGTGALRGAVATFLDITHRKSAEEALRESEEQLRLVTEHVPVSICYFDSGLRYRFINKTFEQWYKVSASELLGRPMEDFFKVTNFSHDPDFNFRRYVDEALSGKEVSFERTLYDGDGRAVHRYSTFVPHIGEGGEVKELFAHGVDITERKRAEEEKERTEAQLRQAQKLEAIGSLAGGIAHDFNNILTPIIGFADLLQGDLPKGSPEAENVARILSAGDRARDLVRQILTFSRQNERERQPVAVASVLKDALKLLRAAIPATIEIRTNIDENCGNVLGDPTQIHQVVMNLCTNAYQTMGSSGGTVEVSLTAVDVTPELARTHANLWEGPYVRLTVDDTGPGIDPSIGERIFDPFFTTKRVGEGTGLGLSVVHGIVNSHGGAITFQSELGKGTSFHVYLPGLVREAEKQSPSEEGEAPLQGREHVLLVDDEEPIVRFSQQMLEALGYRVTSTTSSLEALSLFHAEPDSFDMVLTDVTMPSMTGVDLAREMMGVRADLPIILMTGFTEFITAGQATKMGIRKLIMKPFETRKLAKTIREVLDEGKLSAV